MKKNVLLIVACGVVWLIAGCGGSVATPAPAVKAVDTSLLAGNWLITESMPSNSFDGEQPNPFRLAVNFDVSGNVISTAGFGNDRCTNGAGLTFGLPSGTGTIATDGSFTAQTVDTFPSQTVTIQGLVPKSAGASWSGTYSSVVNLLSPLGCATSSSGSFTATPFPLVNGTYTGATTAGLISAGPVVPPPTSIEITIQQGGDAANQVINSRFPKISILTGSIRVQGSSCFASGVTDGTSLSIIQGNSIQLAFSMDDGSTLRLEGLLKDVTESQITAGIVTARGGRCGDALGYTFETRVLTRKT